MYIYFKWGKGFWSYSLHKKHHKMVADLLIIVVAIIVLVVWVSYKNIGEVFYVNRFICILDSTQFFSKLFYMTSYKFFLLRIWQLIIDRQRKVIIMISLYNSNIDIFYLISCKFFYYLIKNLEVIRIYSRKLFYHILY